MINRPSINSSSKAFRYFELACLVVLAMATHLEAQPARDRILGELLINELPGQTEVLIELNFPVRLMRNFPETSGDSLLIQIEPILINPHDRDALYKRESIAADRINAADISEVVYEGDSVDGFRLMVTFNKIRQFTVTQGKDFRSIHLTIKNPEPGQGTE